MTEPHPSRSREALRSPLGCFEIALLAILATICVIVAFVAWSMNRPDLYLNPLDRFFMTKFDARFFQAPRSLIPEVFSAGASKVDFSAAMEGAGYREATGRSESLDELWYSKGGPSVIVCSNTFGVEATFDETGLRKALAHRWSNCL